jgi:hypothetical protein
MHARQDRKRRLQLFLEHLVFTHARGASLSGVPHGVGCSKGCSLRGVAPTHVPLLRWLMHCRSCVGRWSWCQLPRWWHCALVRRAADGGALAALTKPEAGSCCSETMGRASGDAMLASTGWQHARQLGVLHQQHRCARIAATRGLLGHRSHTFRGWSRCAPIGL